MSFKEKGLSDEIKVIYNLIDKAKENYQEKVEGEYLGSREFDGKKEGELNVLHAFKNNDVLIGVWGSKDLNDKLRGEEHKKVRVRFKEKRNIGSGRTFKVFVVEVEDK